jgi:hypothetical protein
MTMMTKMMTATMTNTAGSLAERLGLELWWQQQCHFHSDHDATIENHPHANSS